MNNPLNLFFDKIFIISIRRNQNRLNAFLQSNPKLDIEVFPGVDGQELFPEIQYVAHFPQIFFEQHQLSYDRCKDMNKGQLGCAMSNLLVQKEIINRGLNKALILEDDAKLIDNRLEYFGRVVKELPTDWDLLYLGYNAPTKWAEINFTRPFVRLKHMLRPIIKEGMLSNVSNKNFFSTSYSKYLKVAGVYNGTHAYALSLSGAYKIVELDTPLKRGYDITLMFANYHKLINGFAVNKPLFVPNSKFETTLVN